MDFPVRAKRRRLNLFHLDFTNFISRDNATIRPSTQCIRPFFHSTVRPSTHCIRPCVYPSLRSFFRLSIHSFVQPFVRPTIQSSDKDMNGLILMYVIFAPNCCTFDDVDFRMKYLRSSDKKYILNYWINFDCVANSFFQMRKDE